MDINKKNKMPFLLFFAIFTMYLTGCAEINPFNAPTEILKHPLGTDSIRIGMSKKEVISIWGKPDRINRLKSSDEWQTPREEWVYLGRYSKLPLDKDYLSKTKYIIFDGNNVVSINEKSSASLYELSKEKAETKE